MKLRDLVKEVSDAMRRHDPFVMINGQNWPIVDYPGGVQRVVIQHGQMDYTPYRRKYDTTILLSLGGGKQAIDRMTEQAVRNFGHQVIRIHRGMSGTDQKPFICHDGAIDGTYVQDIELECTKLVLGAKAPGIASMIV